MKTRNELNAREVDALQDTLLRRLGDTSVPTLPQVAMRVLELVTDKNSTFKQFAKLIETDQALSGRLLRMANSPFFGQLNPVTKIERATILLGMDRLKALALGFHLTKAASNADGATSLKRVWTLSLFRACLACRLAERFDRSSSGEAFIIALMSDAGLPLMAGLVGDLYTQSVDENAPPDRRYRAEFTTLPFTHVDVAAAMCKLWNLPEMLCKPITAHHTRPRPFTKGDTAGMLHAIAYYVGSVPHQPPEHAQVARDSAALARTLFGLKPLEVRELIEQAASDLDVYKDFFQHILDETLSLESIIETANSYLADSSDELARDAAPATAAGPMKRIFTPNFVLEAARASDDMVRVYIDDPDGNRLVTEEFKPAERTDDDIASILMLNDLGSDEANRVVTTIRGLAA